MGRPWHFIVTSLWRNVSLKRKNNRITTLPTKVSPFTDVMPFLTYLSFNIFTWLIPNIKNYVFICDFYGLPCLDLYWTLQGWVNIQLCLWSAAHYWKKTDKWACDPMQKSLVFPSGLHLCASGISVSFPTAVSSEQSLPLFVRGYLYSLFLTTLCISNAHCCQTLPCVWFAVLCTWCQAGRVAKQPFGSYLGLFKWQKIRPKSSQSYASWLCIWRENPAVACVCVFFFLVHYLFI